MNNEEAIKAIKSNYPPENYTMLREALDLAIIALENADRLNDAEDLLSDARSLLDDVHCYETKVYKEIGIFLHGEEEEE